ncbi:MAG: hypothetical protein GF400_05855, partial [Candidatus Eisenbacteria bacterium]|nr:hypothetical protein [Candidatus Eisenbacteria bacterium]
MNRALLIGLPLLFLSALLAGCAGSGVGLGDAAPSSAHSGGGDAAASDSLSYAESQYREALGHYVCDEWDEAIPLLRRALMTLENARPRSVELRRAKDSLRSRIRHFLMAAPQ